jgi:hypothetical protein
MLPSPPLPHLGKSGAHAEHQPWPQRFIASALEWQMEQIVIRACLSRISRVRGYPLVAS